MNVGIHAAVDRDVLVDAIRKITVDAPAFDANQWSQYDGRFLLLAGVVVLRELNIVSRSPLPEDVALSLRSYFATLTAEEFEKVKPTTFAPTVASS